MKVGNAGEDPGDPLEGRGEQTNVSGEGNMTILGYRRIMFTKFTRRAEGSIWTTVRARLLGAAGVPSPGHAFTGILQELGNTFQSPPAYDGCGSPDSKGPGLGRYRCTGLRSEQASGGRGSRRSRETRDRQQRAGRSRMSPLYR